ncbi:MAG: hypothetical protein D3904_06820, partial [Candidatus Electrothrix sp. EH2]|nr:hypothetical protein [Candidatus Electrothrix sp. EH2]
TLAFGLSIRQVLPVLLYLIFQTENFVVVSGRDYLLFMFLFALVVITCKSNIEQDAERDKKCCTRCYFLHEFHSGAYTFVMRFEDKRCLIIT